MRTVPKLFRLTEEVLTDGLVGLEVEVEGVNLPVVVLGWRKDMDGSLKSEESCEYVLRKPAKSLTEAENYLDLLGEAYIENNTEVFDSVRAGVHVHINVQDLNIVELYNFMTLYMILEEVLVRWCGEGRSGNLFCLRASDAPYLVHQLIMAAKEDRYSSFLELFSSQDLRYASMNVTSIPKFGSLEFRSMRGTRNMGLIKTWFSMLYYLKDFSKTFKDPKDVVSTLNEKGVENFLSHIIGPYEEEIKYTPNLEELISVGLMNAQDIAYCTNWERYLTPHYKNPFKNSEVL